MSPDLEEEDLVAAPVLLVLGEPWPDEDGVLKARFLFPVHP